MKFRLKEILKERGMTVEALSRLSGVSYPTVSNLYQGRTSNPNYETLRAIARALEIPIEALEAEESEEENSLALPLAA
jgi:transcriptional regulator with XRE-family HTH domain